MSLPPSTLLNIIAEEVNNSEAIAARSKPSSLIKVLGLVANAILPRQSATNYHARGDRNSNHPWGRANHTLLLLKHRGYSPSAVFNNLPKTNGIVGCSGNNATEKMSNIGAVVFSPEIGEHKGFQWLIEEIHCLLQKEAMPNVQFRGHLSPGFSF